VILAGDVGGTKIHLGLFSGGDGAPVKVSEVLLETRSVKSLAEELAAFAGGRSSRIRSCAIGVAGPVLAGRVRGANLPWELDEGSLSGALGVRVRLLNDLEASGIGLAALGPADVVTLQEGAPPAGGNRALLSPGTGLGEAILHFDGRVHRPVPSEGGHADFSARTDEEIALLVHLRRLYGRVSCERVLSGPGIANVLRWLQESGTVPDDSGIELAPPGAPDAESPARISRAALDGSSAICREALRVWISAFGAEAGNTALRGLAVAGVFLAGGIPARLVPLLQEGGFLAAFRAKEPHRDILSRIPVHVVTNPETTLFGAYLVAEQEIGGASGAGV
jgi:glucokinase